MSAARRLHRRERRARGAHPASHADAAAHRGQRAGFADGLGRVRVYHQVRLGQTRASGCREAGIVGSLNGSGEWCGPWAAFTYRLAGRHSGEGRLEHRHDPPAAATLTFTVALPATPTGAAARDPALAAGATRRGYRVHVPTGYRSARPVPAVLVFHGNGGSARDMEAGSGLSELADRRGFLAVYPQGLSVGAGQAFWASSGRVELGIDELRFTGDLLDHIQARLRVDPARVAAAGHSAGGGVTARLACELAGRVAAVAAVAPALFTEPVECRPSRAVPLLAVHGTADEVLPYGGQGASVASPLPLPALPAWLAEWATRDGCPGDPAVFLDTAEVTGVRWTGCRDGTEVVHYRINGGGHDLPVTIAGQPIARVLWDFVAARPIPS